MVISRSTTSLRMTWFKRWEPDTRADMQLADTVASNSKYVGFTVYISVCVCVCVGTVHVSIFFFLMARLVTVSTDVTAKPVKVNVIRHGETTSSKQRRCNKSFVHTSTR